MRRRVDKLSTSFPTLAATFHTKARRFPHSQHAAADEDGRRRRPVAEEAGADGRFQLHKSRGQHLLTNPRVLDSIVRRAQVRSTDTVLEIGPGTGNLTVRLLEAAAKVVAVEIDERMVYALHRRVSELGFQDRLTVIKKDALKAHFPPFDIVVANIPYGISSPLIAKLLFEPNRPSFRNATLLLQKEFARRLLADPGDSEFNRLAANSRLVANIVFLMDVSKRNFVPCPKVDSSLVCIHPKPEIPAVNFNEWLAFTRICFVNKNKTLGAIFKQKKLTVELFTRAQSTGSSCDNNSDSDDHTDEDEGNSDVSEMDEGDITKLGIFREKIGRVLKAGAFVEKRPSKMSSEEFLQLLHLFNQEGVLFHT